MKNRLVLQLVILGLVLMPVSVILGVPDIAAQEEKIPMDLDGTTWDVEMVYISEKGKKEISQETLIFKDKKFVSKEFEDNGYEPTNYSLTVEEDGTTRFGTMQLNKKETSFWKGSVKGDSIDGSVHVQYAGGTNKTTYFNGKITSGALKPKVKEEPQFPKPDPVAPIPPAPEVSEKSENPADTGERAVEQEVSVPVIQVPDLTSEEAEVDGSQISEIEEDPVIQDAEKQSTKKKKWF